MTDAVQLGRQDSSRRRNDARGGESRMKSVKIGLVALVLPLAAAGPAEAKGRPDDHYRVRAGHTLQVRGDAQRDGAVVRRTDPGHGALTIGPDGSFRYTPAA